MSDKKASRVAVEIGSRFGETGERPLRQIDRMIDLMGLEWVRDIAKAATILRERVDAEVVRPSVLQRQDGTPRTLGGLFFKLARDLGEKAMAEGAIERRAFYRAFFDKAPTPKAPKPAPAPPPPRPRKVVPPPRPSGPVRASTGNVRHDRRGRPAPQVEVYTARRAGR